MSDQTYTPEAQPSATPGFTPGLGVDGKPKPYFPDHTRVRFQLSKDVYGCGHIRGLVSQQVIDFWIIELEPGTHTVDRSVYPWSCLVVHHTCIQPL